MRIKEKQIVEQYLKMCYVVYHVSKLSYATSSQLSYPRYGVGRPVFPLNKIESVHYIVICSELIGTFFPKLNSVTINKGLFIKIKQ